jgi:hypothetical protein
MENENINIAEICTELEKLARGSALTQRSVDACTQAASLLSRMREAILTGLVGNWHTPECSATQEIVEKLKWILVEQGEG